MSFDDCIEFDDKTVFCYMLGLIDALHVYRKNTNTKELEEYYDMYKSINEIEKFCMYVFFASDEKIYNWHKKYSFMICSIDEWRYTKPLTCEHDENAEIFPNNDCILSYFIGLSHWILTDYDTNWFDPISSFMNHVRKDLCPDVEYDRMLDLIEMLETDRKYEQYWIKASEFLGITDIVNKSTENNEPYFEPELKNFLEKNK
jgi:hypothetical protein